MRLIDADAINEHKFPLTPLRYHVGWNDAIDAIIENAPTVEVVHGQWIDQIGLKKCSVCNCHQIDTTPYCPNCGAKMDWGNEDG